MVLDLNAMAGFLPWLNILIIPALAFVIRIDRRLGQHEVLHQVNDREHAEFNRRLSALEARLVHE